MSVSPGATTSYTLTAINAAGTATATITVTVETQLPTITDFWANPYQIASGQSATLNWAVSRADSLSLDNGIGAVTGTSQVVSPSAATTYRLTGTNLVGSVSATVTVGVGTPGSLVWTKTIVYGFGQELAEDQPGMGTTFIQSDYVGSPSFMTDANGLVIGRSKNLPFGERLSSWGQKTLRRYTNHEDDPDSGAIYMQAREQLPAYGKFAQVDPAYDQTKDDPESWNLYNYVTNNPVTHTDPDGRIAFGVDGDYAANVQEVDALTYSGQDTSCAFFDTNPAAEVEAAFAYAAQHAGVSDTITVYTVETSVATGAQTGASGDAFKITVDFSINPVLHDGLTPLDPSERQLSQAGQNFISANEGGDKPAVYLDSMKLPTAGVGHLLTADEKKQYPVGKTVPQSVRSEWFNTNLQEAQATVRSLVTAKLTQSQFDALTDFAYQMGPKHLGQSNLLKDINAGSPSGAQIYTDFHGWNLGGAGVPARRDREINMFNDAIYP